MNSEVPDTMLARSHRPTLFLPPFFPRFWLHSYTLTLQFSFFLCTHKYCSP